MKKVGWIYALCYVSETPTVFIISCSMVRRERIILLIQVLGGSRSDYRSCGRGIGNGRCLLGEEIGREGEVVVLFHCEMRQSSCFL